MSAFFLNCAIAVGALLLYLGAQFVLSLAMTLISQGAYLIRFPDAEFDEIYAFCEQFIIDHQCFGLIFSALFTFTILFGYFRARGQNPLQELRAQKATLGHMVLFMFLGTLLNFVIGFLVSIIPWPEAWLSVYETESSQLLQGEGFIMQVLAIAICAPILEEVIFSGMMQTYLSRVMPKLLAIFIQCSIFGLIHGTPLWMCYTFILGLFFTFANEKSGSLWTGIAMHIGFNLFALIPMA